MIDYWELQQRVAAVCHEKGWDKGWKEGGCCLHLEVSELIEALRGKHGDPVEEAGDVLFTLLGLLDHYGISLENAAIALIEKMNRKGQGLGNHGGIEYGTPPPCTSRHWDKASDGYVTCKKRKEHEGACVGDRGGENLYWVEATRQDQPPEVKPSPPIEVETHDLVMRQRPSLPPRQDVYKAMMKRSEELKKGAPRLTDPDIPEPDGDYYGDGSGDW